MSAHRTAGVYQPRSRRGQIADALASFRDWLRNLILEALWRTLGVALIVLAVAMLAALASYDAADPSFNVSTGREAGNWLGASGAYAADLLFEVFGVAALAIGAAIAAWGWQTVKGRRVKQFGLRSLALLLGALFLAAGLGAVAWFAALPAGAGGIPGRMAVVFTAKTASAFAAGWLTTAIPALFSGLGAVLILAAAGLTGRKIMALGYGAYALSGRAVTSLVGLAFRRPAREEKDEETGGEWDDDETQDVEERADFLESEDDADEPATRDAPEKRVRRADDRRRKAKAKSASQPALNLAEGEYQLPPLGLLTEPPAESLTPAFNDDALEENARLLEAVLGDFGVRGRIVAVRPGPVVTLYELEPAAGVKSSRVISLSDDIARSMSAVAARVAVIPGRNVIGIELPNGKGAKRSICASCSPRRNTRNRARP